MNHKRTIYLAGPMEHVSEGEAKAWRNDVIQRIYLSTDLVEFRDPTRRIHGFEPTAMKRIFELDIRDINESDILIANLDEMQKIPRHGTAMEVFYAAYVRRIPVIGFKSNKDFIHPFFESLVTEWRSSPVKAAETILEHYL
jgi:nucleoside 2-deoxyribosyltransferase